MLHRFRLHRVQGVVSWLQQLSPPLLLCPPLLTPRMNRRVPKFQKEQAGSWQVCCDAFRELPRNPTAETSHLRRIRNVPNARLPQSLLSPQQAAPPWC